jgi:hypothetical protein
VKQTPIQHATTLVLGAYAAACRTLTPAERDVLRDIIAARLAADYLEARGELGTDDVERAA